MTTHLFLFTALVFASMSAHADPCQDFFAEATYTPYLGRMAQALRLDPEKGVVLDTKLTKLLGLKPYSSDVAHRLETDPGSKLGPFKSVKEGLSITDQGGDPREFEIVEDYMSHYAENFVRPLPKKRPAPEVFVYRYRLGYRNGICVPLKVVKLDSSGERRLFDFDRCYELKTAKATPADSELQCEALPVFKKILNDERLPHSNSSSQPAPKLSR